MSRAYYYFAASLPLIDWDIKLPITMEEFLSDCRKLLTDKDYHLVKDLLEGDGLTPETGQAEADAWIRFNKNLRNELALFRAQRLNKDPSKYVRDFKDADLAMRDIIQQAFKLPNLLSAQKMIDRAMWDFLDELSAGHYFDLVIIFVYGLKLKILERHWEYRSSKGQSRLDELKVMEFPESCLLASGSK